MSSPNSQPPPSGQGPIFSPPPEPRSGKTLEFLAMLIGGGLFVALPCIWIIYVMLQFFEVLPK